VLLFVIQAQFEKRVNHGSGSIIGGCQQPGHPIVDRPSVLINLGHRWSRQKSTGRTWPTLADGIV
jgi:hypothetical protein